MYDDAFDKYGPLIVLAGVLLMLVLFTLKFCGVVGDAVNAIDPPAQSNPSDYSP